MDKAVLNLIQCEEFRQKTNVNLIASENYVSQEIQLAMGSVFTNKYAEGYPGARYYGGCENVDTLEDIARERACILFGAEHANVQPHSGSQANMAAYASILQPGDTILAAHLNSYGHLTHSANVSFVSKLYKVYTYNTDENGFYDYDEIMNIAKEVRPKLIVCGASSCPVIIDYKKFRDIANEVNAYLMADMAHVAGLVAAGLHPNPVQYADIVTSTTHKTLRGPRGGLILCKKEFAKFVDKAVFPGNQGGPLENIIAAKAMCFYEAMQPEFVDYQLSVLNNCRVLADTLEHNSAGRLKLVCGKTENHLCLVDVRGTGKTGLQCERELAQDGIIVNKNMIPNDPESPKYTSGIRLGTAAITTMGAKEKDMIEIADHIISRLVKDDVDYLFGQRLMNKIFISKITGSIG